jgi:hypothetical protein
MCVKLRLITPKHLDLHRICWRRQHRWGRSRTTASFARAPGASISHLAELLASGDVRVEHDDSEDAYHLTAPEIDNPAEINRFDIPAGRLLVRINGLGRARSADFRPVTLSGKYTTADSDHIFVAAAPMEARARLTATAVVLGPDGQPKPDPPSPWPGRLALADTHSEVAEALNIMGGVQPLGWVELYKVHELIRGAIQPKKTYELGWATKADDSAFTGSANRADVSGDDARHARNSGLPPARTMSLAEGRSYISDLVTKWLGPLSGNP